MTDGAGTDGAGVAARGFSSEPVSLDDVPGRLVLDLPAREEALDLVHEVVGHLWAQSGSGTDRDRFRFETAVIEVLANIVEHAHRVDPQVGATGAERRLDVVVAVHDGAAWASFGDNGLPVALDLGSVALPDEDAESGRGLAMTLAAVDEVAYARVGDRNHWSLRCDLS